MSSAKRRSAGAVQARIMSHVEKDACPPICNCAARNEQFLRRFLAGRFEPDGVSVRDNGTGRL